MAGKLMQWLNEYWAAARNPNGLEPQRIAESGHECETSPLDLMLRDVREVDSDLFEINEKDLDQPEDVAQQKQTWGLVRQLISSACLLIGMVSGILFFVAFVSMPAPQGGGHMTHGLNRLGNVVLMFGSLITLFVFPLVGVAVASLDVSIRKSHDKICVALLGNICCVFVAISIVVLTWLCTK